MNLSDELIEAIDDLTQAADTHTGVPEKFRRGLERLRQLRNDIINTPFASTELDGEDE